ncbi:HERC4 [Symbiodinium natans]|uniref:HERC4 protein n=1 Tax=Symbiodinium natans TaxID=878477 RepID=A0A812V4D9_9DINO|nr:HERC4 [Symbiodinium natans]
MALRLFFVVAALRGAEASLRGNLHANAGSMSTEQLRETVLQEVMTALGSGNRVTEKRLKTIETALRPTFQAMPKNAYGNLEDAAARYVLHRLFVQRHAMYIKGLEANGMNWKNMTTTEVLDQHVPSFVLSLFEDRLKDQGLGLHELTVLAATLEHLIHDEAVSRLAVVYEAHNLSMADRVQEVVLQDLIDTYMTIFLVGTQNLSATTVSKERALIVESYPGWHETQKFTMQVRGSVLASKDADADFSPDNFSFRAATQIVEEIGERYGRWQDSECRDLKSLLVKYEHADTGRVLLKDFYSAALGGQWQFSESIDYLRELGALDESDPAHLAVFIPNYVNSQSNCVASSSIYSVCCINECEALLGSLEAKVAAPEATPEQILELVAAMPSATLRAPRELSRPLADRLREVAAQHGGAVPLHGRLFAQWLHHAYPRECPYPHVAGKTNPMTADEWMQARGQSVSATKEDMKRYLEAAPSAKPAAELPWSAEEELVAREKKPTGFGALIRKALFVVFGLVAAYSFGPGAEGIMLGKLATGQDPRFFLALWAQYGKEGKVRTLSGNAPVLRDHVAEKVSGMQVVVSAWHGSKKLAKSKISPRLTGQMRSYVVTWHVQLRELQEAPLDASHRRLFQRILDSCAQAMCKVIVLLQVSWRDDYLLCGLAEALRCGAELRRGTVRDYTLCLQSLRRLNYCPWVGALRPVLAELRWRLRRHHWRPIDVVLALRFLAAFSVQHLPQVRIEAVAFCRELQMKAEKRLGDMRHLELAHFARALVQLNDKGGLPDTLLLERVAENFSRRASDLPLGAMLHMSSSLLAARADAPSEFRRVLIDKAQVLPSCT